jgi:cobalt/nickel transport system permease protein
MAAVLLIQALVLGDGGLSALGANVLNMAILPAALVSLAKSRSLTTAALLAGAAVPLAAALIVVETALFRPLAEVSAFGSFATAILGAHLWIGVLEAAATASLIAALSWTAQCSPVRTGWRLALACVSAALLLAALSSISSRLPDGYEAAAQASGQERLLAE